MDNLEKRILDLENRINNLEVKNPDAFAKAINEQLLKINLSSYFASNEQ